MPETVGVDFLLKADSNTIGGREDATLNLERDASDLAPTQGTGTTFRRQLVGLKDFSIDTDALWLTGGAALNGFSPTVTVNPSASSPPTLERISEVTLSIERELVEFANSSNAEYLARQPSVLSVSSDITVDVDASAFYSTGNASRQLVDAWDSTSGAVDVDIALPNGNTSFESTFVVSTIDLPTPTDDAAEATFTLESTGVVTETIDSALGAGLNELLTNIFQDDPSSLTAELTTTQTGNVEFTGPVFPSSVEITIPVEGSEDGVNTSVTLDAAGALTIQETA
jgi:predicted secreted protein